MTGSNMLFEPIIDDVLIFFDIDDEPVAPANGLDILDMGIDAGFDGIELVTELPKGLLKAERKELFGVAE